MWPLDFIWTVFLWLQLLTLEGAIWRVQHGVRCFLMSLLWHNLCNILEGSGVCLSQRNRGFRRLGPARSGSRIQTQVCLIPKAGRGPSIHAYRPCICTPKCSHIFAFHRFPSLDWVCQGQEAKLIRLTTHHPDKMSLNNFLFLSRPISKLNFDVLQQGRNCL